jgi:ABC-type microcin C transport system duplicated ATPase subunit YejF
MEKHPVVKDPIKVAEMRGEQILEVFQGDFRNLHPLLPKEGSILAVLDLFEKGDKAFDERIKAEWKEHVGGDVFIP